MHDTHSTASSPSTGQDADYKTIFNQRGAAYHQAMAEFPEARSQEFINIINMAALQLGQVVCDVPSGGGYLQRYLSCDDYDVIALETSNAFYQYCTEKGKCRAVLTELDDIDLPDASVDCVISLAGLHHLSDRPAFFREAYRILKTGGSCCVADVKADTRTADFLNVFVDRWNSMGHKGDFFSADAPKELESAGFKVVDHHLKNYHWHFRSIEDMCRYVTLLFGLDRAQPGETLKGIENYVGYHTVDGACKMNWGLLFMKGIK